MADFGIWIEEAKLPVTHARVSALQEAVVFQPARSIP
jgi:hypothetical protein